ncbi:MAG: zinc ribbon domain-containing protein [Ruminococcaceae bacterium]|nr:zinc ribbon domain-containing protein [Oscillospiraceae bacterium]
MFCSKCGKEINDEAVVCVHCGCATGNFKNEKEKDTPIIINNNNSASSSAAASAAAGVGGRIRRKYSFLFDLIMIFFTGGLWIIWMILRPKYY